MNDELPKLARQLVLVEDDHLLANLLANLLKGHGFKVTICENVASAIKTLRRTDADIVVSDIDLGPGPSGLDLAAKIAQTKPYLPVVLISNYEVPPDAHSELLKNIIYLRKREILEPQLLIKAIEELLRGSELSSAHSLRRLDNPLVKLTKSQYQVLKFIAEGLTNQEISHLRGTSLRATELLVSRLFTALEIESDHRTNSRVLATRIYTSSLGFFH